MDVYEMVDREEPVWTIDRVIGGYLYDGDPVDVFLQSSPCCGKILYRWCEVVDGLNNEAGLFTLSRDKAIVGGQRRVAVERRKQAEQTRLLADLIQSACDEADADEVVDALNKGE